MDRGRAALALSVTQGLISDDPHADRMASEAFDSLEDAATAYAYLVGFLVQEMALLRSMPVAELVTELRARLLA